MLQQEVADDYVLATGVTHTVRHFADLAFREAGITLEWRGKGADEIGVDVATGRTLVQVDPRYFRPTEVDLLIGNAGKAKRVLGWEPKVTLPELAAEMIASDLAALRVEMELRERGNG
jgi:GDPmannose 4,6-dehydratase